MIFDIYDQLSNQPFHEEKKYNLLKDFKGIYVKTYYNIHETQKKRY